MTRARVFTLDKMCRNAEKCDRICGNMRIFANLCINKYSKFWKCHYMRENMRYAHFCKICEICCDRMIAINRYPYTVDDFLHFLVQRLSLSEASGWAWLCMSVPYFVVFIDTKHCSCCSVFTQVFVYVLLSRWKANKVVWLCRSFLN